MRRERRHGTPSCYVMGCRLPECRAANTEAKRRQRADARARLAEGVALHGEPTTYVNNGCRCVPCTRAFDAYNRERRAERVARGGKRG